MFSTEAVSSDGFDKVQLKDGLSQTFVEIIPRCGAVMHGFNVLNNGQWLNVIDHYADADDFAANVTIKGFKGCKLSPFACRISNATYTFGEGNYIIQKFLLSGHALHGLLYDAPFTIVSQTADKTCAKLVLKYSYDGWDIGYTFRYDCIISYQLTAHNTLTIITEIINTDAGLIPVQDGWHPYFTFGGSIDELQLEFQSKELVMMNEELIPTTELKQYEEFGSLKKIGSQRFDDCFTLNFAECQPLCVLRDPAKKIQLEIYPEKSYPYLQLYTPPHRQSIAIENLSASPDAFNNKMGLQILEAGEKLTFTTTYKLNVLK